MMKRYILSVVFGILAFMNFSTAQVQIDFSDETAVTNGTVDVDLIVNGFTSISTVQFSVEWDSLVMTYNSLVSVHPQIIALNEDNIGSDEGSINVNAGQFTLSWTDPNINASLPEDAVFITVRFDIVGDECDETAITLSDTPTSIEINDSNFLPLDVTSTPGTIMIDGTDCGGTGGGDELTVAAPDECIAPGGTYCMPLTVTNFTGVQAGSGTILWDPAVLEYTGIKNASLTGFNQGSLNDTNTANGELKFVWSNTDPSNPLELEDGTSIFDIAFNVLGADGDMSVITLSEAGSLGFEWFDDDDNVIPQELTNGKITISDSKGPPFRLIVSEETVDENASTVCVSVSVENFTNILSMQYVMSWDNSVITNATPMNFNLTGLTASNFNPVPSSSTTTLSWSGSIGLTIPDNQIYDLCFDRVGDCEDVSVVDIISMTPTNIEIVDGSAEVIENVEIDPGSVTVTCTADCSIVNIDQPCPGELGGNVTVDVPSDNCTYSWVNDSGVEVSTDANLLGVGEGTYILTVTCNGSEACTLTAEVDALDALVVTGDVTNVICGDLGAIDAMVTGGSGNYNYTWTPVQGNTPNISNLGAGEYSLVVMDTGTGCSSSSVSFTVIEEEVNININSMIQDESCDGGDGGINLTVTGGCEPYSYSWSDSSIGNTPNAMNLSADTYSVTVTDNQSNSATASFVVDGHDPIVMVGSASITGTMSGASNGAISVMITGGADPLTYNWVGTTPALPNSNSITGLAAGNYVLTVVDANGCEMEFGPFVVTTINPTGEPEANNVDAVNNAFGFAISCNGANDGVLSGNLTGGNLDVTATLSGTESRTLTLSAYETFSFDNLGAGTYTLTLTNSSGETVFDNIVLLEPAPFVLDLSADDVGCDNDQGDGFIDVFTSGGVGELTYEWNDVNLNGASVDNLDAGFYTVLITDEVGCELMETIEVESCLDPTDPCYEVRDVITPNGDGVNDRFLVTCVNDFPASLLVFDRWGKEVYSQAVYDGLWEGVSSSGENLPEGGYMYVLTIDFGQGNREIMKGTLTLLRN